MNAELGKKIEQLEDEKMHLRLDVDVQKLETKKWRKEKNKAEEDLDSLKTDYKKLRLSMRTAGKCQDAQGRKEALEKSLSEAQNEKIGVKARIAELEKSLHQHRSRNSAIELKASLDKIEELKRKVEELEIVLQNSKLQVGLLEASNERCNKQLHQSQSQIRDRDYIMGKAVAQVQEVADHLQT
ncbi:hypothetical protein V6Z12_A10G154100 [Gossypium hirsutum]